MENSRKEISLIINEIEFVIIFSDQQGLLKVESPFQAVVDYADESNILIFLDNGINNINQTEQRNLIFHLLKEISSTKNPN